MKRLKGKLVHYVCCHTDVICAHVAEVGNGGSQSRWSFPLGIPAWMILHMNVSVSEVFCSEQNAASVTLVH